MSSHHAGHDHGDLHNADVHHEESDINVRAIIWFVVVLTAIVLSMNVSMYGMFKLLQYYERKTEPAVSPLTRPASDPKAFSKDFPKPLLQVNPWTDLDGLPRRAGAAPPRLRLGGREARRRAHSDRQGEGDAPAEGHSRSRRRWPTSSKAHTSPRPVNRTAAV